MKFLSTCPARGTTFRRNAIIVRSLISIHVPREGHDLVTMICRPKIRFFYPRAPGGARPVPFAPFTLDRAFLSTCPGRGTTRRAIIGEWLRDFSIHVPREGHDRALFLLIFP